MNVIAKIDSQETLLAVPAPVLVGDVQGRAATQDAPREPVWRALLRYPLAIVGIAVLILLALIALLAPILFPTDPMLTVAPAVIPPFSDWAYPLGTDPLGRNVLAGLAHGARMSLSIGALSAGVAIAIGLGVGIIAGYVGGIVDDVLMRVVELFQTTPSFLLAVVLVTLGGSSISMITFAIGLGSFPIIARLVRAEFRTLRNAEFVQASHSQGYGNLRLIAQDILPNALPPVIVTGSVLVASAILVEAGLSFLGMGDANVQTWGAMIGVGRTMLREAWYLTAIPGLLIMATILSINLIGDALNDILNPRLRRGR